MTCPRCNDTGQVSVDRHGPLFPPDKVPCASCCNHDSDGAEIPHCKRCGLIIDGARDEHERQIHELAEAM